MDTTLEGVEMRLDKRRFMWIAMVGIPVRYMKNFHSKTINEDKFKFSSGLGDFVGCQRLEPSLY